ncbi:MAG: SDR family NAD(P)-dependent oxidoreductase [Candidatus Promineifilaceae bacterium]
MDFSGQVALVTGAASGMGAATARAFAAAGADVLLVDINAELLATVAREIGMASLVGDLAESAFCELAVQTAQEQYGRLDIVVNCAGIILRADAEMTTDAAWQRMMNVNVNGVFFMSRAAIPVMKQQGKGAIINFGSIWGDVGATNVVAYCASKGAVHQITRAMALDYATDGIRINAVCPGEVNTPMIKSGRDRPPTAEDMQALADSVPMKRLADPSEIAQVVLFLASDAASYMTGAMVPVDAGFTAR